MKITLLVGLIGFFAATCVQAGSVITSNLPPNVAIVNINAREDGSDLLNQALWRSPFSVNGPASLLKKTLSAGTYSFRVINSKEAVALYPSLTPAQTNQMFEAWTYNSPWITDYLVFDSSATSNNSVYQLFDGAFDAVSFNNSSNAYYGVIAHGNSDALRVGPQGRNSTNYVKSYTLTNDATLIFVIPDNILSDNTGGVSVLVSLIGPALSIEKSGQNVTVTWPTNSPAGTFLMQKTNVADAVWSSVTNAPVIVGGKVSVAVSATNASRFYRLQIP